MSSLELGLIPKMWVQTTRLQGLYPNHGNSIHLHPSRHVHRKGHTSSSKYRKDVSLLGQLLKSLCYNNARVLWIGQEGTMGWWNGGPSVALLSFDFEFWCSESTCQLIGPCRILWFSLQQSLQSYNSTVYQQCGYLTAPPILQPRPTCALNPAHVTTNQRIFAVTPVTLSIRLMAIPPCLGEKRVPFYSRQGVALLWN